MTGLWSELYPDETADFEQYLPPVNLHSHHVLPYESHDDKPDERADRFVTTGEGDLDLAGRALKAGT